MRKMVVIIGCIMGLVFVIFGLGIVPQLYAAPIEIKLAHVDPTDVCISKKGAAATVFKNLVETETKGEVVVNVMPAGQLGGERELVEATKLGTIQMCFVSAAIAGYYKEAQVLDIPYLFSSEPVAWEVMDGWFGKEMADDCLQKTGMRILSYGETGFRNFSSSVRPIKTLADMKGFKIRVMENPLIVTMMKALGAAPIPIAWPETYTALQQKVAEGGDFPISVMTMGKLHEVQKYVTLDGHAYSTDFNLINEKFFQRLPKETQKIIKVSAIKSGLVGRGIQQLNSAIGVAQLKEKGIEFYVQTASERSIFVQTAQKPVIEYLEKQVDKKWIDKLMKAVKEVEAKFSK